MGSVFGKINEETPKYDVVEKGESFEVREYAPCLVAEVTYEGGHFERHVAAAWQNGRNKGGFMTLADYIGAIGRANNTKVHGEGHEAIAMTAPVITQEQSKGKSEKIAMTAPVITSENKSEEPADSKPSTTMQFVLPSKYTLSDVPKPNDPRVTVREVAPRCMGVITFNGNTMSGGYGYKLIQEQAEKLRTALTGAGYKVLGDFELARYNPPWTPGPLRTNEVCFPVEKN